MKQRYLVQRMDDQRFFCHPADDGRFTQWTKDPTKAHQWVDLDICLMAVKVSTNVWCIPAEVHTLVQ